MWRAVFGPVLFYDLLHTARRGRHLLFRVLYAGVLVALLFLLYTGEVGKRGGSLWSDWRVPQSQRQEVLQFNQAFFTRFTLVQFALIVLLTPGVTAGAIADEKERRTLEFLLTTELRGYEIVLGKLAARLAYMLLMLLTGLPVLALMQLLGGVDPQLVLASFGAAGVTLLSLSCLSIFNSVLAAKPRTAIFGAYAQVCAYFAVSLMLVKLSAPNAIPEGAVWFCGGNPYLALQELARTMQATGSLAGGLSAVLLRYLVFHGVVAGLCLVGSLLGLRWWNRRQASEGSRRAFVVFFKPKRLPRVGERPVLWKELYAAPFLHVKRGGMILLSSLWIVGLLFGGALMLARVFLYYFAKSVGGRAYSAPELEHTTPWLTTALGTLAAVAAAIHTAGAFTGERDRQTLDSLLTTPLTNQAIVWGKWWGGVLSVRKACYCLLAIWILGTLTGHADPFNTPVMVIACLVYIAFAAALGLWFSLICRTTLRAMIWTLLVLMFAWGGHLVLVWIIRPLVSIPDRRFGPTAYRYPEWFSSLVEFQTHGLTPTATLYHLVETDRIETLCLFGLMCYAVVAALLILGVVKNFAKAVGRLPLPGQERRIHITVSSQWP